jgi:hypothetical protein
MDHDAGFCLALPDVEQTVHSRYLALTNRRSFVYCLHNSGSGRLDGRNDRLFEASDGESQGESVRCLCHLRDQLAP